MIGTPSIDLHSPGPIGDVTPSTIQFTTGTATTRIIIPNGSSSDCAIQFTGEADRGFYFASNAIRVRFDSTDSLVINDALTNINTNVEIGAGKQFQFAAIGSAASPNVYLATSPFPGFFFTTGSGGTIGFSADNSTNHLLIQTSVGITSLLVLRVPGGANPVLTTTATVTSGAGAQVGTLTNAPAAGNPTSWIPFNDNGTTRYIPAW